jgi:hypothetical protein
MESLCTDGQKTTLTPKPQNGHRMIAPKSAMTGINQVVTEEREVIDQECRSLEQVPFAGRSVGGSRLA